MFNHRMSCLWKRNQRHTKINLLLFVCFENEISEINLSNRFRCLDKSQFFPPGRSIWCNSNRKGPTARPTSTIGGHACCGDSNLCNRQLKPIILDYRQSPATVFNQGDRQRDAQLIIISYFVFLSQSNLTKWIFVFFFSLIFKTNPDPQKYI